MHTHYVIMVFSQMQVVIEPRHLAADSLEKKFTFWSSIHVAMATQNSNCKKYKF